jgi:hypothetical protein
MPESSIRWGSRLGALGAGLGVFAYIAGSLLTPLPSRQSTGEVVIPIILIRGLFLYVALGVVLGLAFYGGLRVAREQFGDSQTQAGEAHTDSIDRMPAALAGVLVVLIWWLVTRFVSALVAFPPVSRLAAQDFAGQIFFGVVFACIGAGLGAVGARMTVRNKLAETVIVVTPPTAPAARAAMPGVADGTIPPEGARSREPGQVTAPEE